MNKKHFILFLALTLLPTQFNARELVEDEVISNCSLTPNFAETRSNYISPEPGKTNKSNNLRRRAGDTEVAEGTQIKIIGRILDERCIPVYNAHIEIWQPNAKGFYKSKISAHSDEFDENFLEYGSAYSDNLGKYDFVSIYPGRVKNRSAFVNFRISHPDFEETYIPMYFSDDKYNDYDDVFFELSKEDKKKIQAIKTGRPANTEPKELNYVFNITLKGKEKFKRY